MVVESIPISQFQSSLLHPPRPAIFVLVHGGRRWWREKPLPVLLLSSILLFPAAAESASLRQAKSSLSQHPHYNDRAAPPHSQRIPAAARNRYSQRSPADETSSCSWLTDSLKAPGQKPPPDASSEPTQMYF